MLLKPLWVLPLFITAMLTFSCNNKDDSSPELNDLYQFKKIDLRPYDLSATVYIPDETAGIGASFKTSIQHDEDFKWTLSAGPNFELYIEDWGDNYNRFNDFKLTLNKSDVFTSTILEKGSNYILYKRALSNPIEVEEYKHISYHVYALIPVDGIYYEIRNKAKGDPLKTAQFMINSIKSFQKCPTN